MNREVVLSEIAKERLEEIFDYLLENWSEKSKEKFVKKLDKSIQAIQSMPESFPVSNTKKEIRKCVVTKQTTLYYQFDEAQIYVLTLFDSRQHPKTLKF